MIWRAASTETTDYLTVVEVLDGNRKKVEYVDKTHERRSVGGHFEDGDLGSGRAIKPDHLPTMVRWHGPFAKMPDIFRGFMLYFVSQEFKDIIEHHEPGVHQFFPVEAYGNDSHATRHMYLLNICQRFDGVDRQASTAKLTSYWEYGSGSVVFDLDIVKNFHLWMDKHIYGQGFYISEAIHTAIVDAKLTGFRFEKELTTGGNGNG